MTTLSIYGTEEHYPNECIEHLKTYDRFLVTFSSNGLNQYFIIMADKYDNNDFDAVRFAVDRTGDHKATVQKMTVESFLRYSRAFTTLCLPQEYQKSR